MIKKWNEWDFPGYMVVRKEQMAENGYGFVVCALSTTKDEAEKYLAECIADDKDRGYVPGIYKVVTTG